MGQAFFALPDLAHDADIILQPIIRTAPGLAVPALDDLRAGDAEPGDETPATRQRIDSAGAHGGVCRCTRRDLDDARAELDPLGDRGQIRQGCDRVGAVSFGRPYAVVAEFLRSQDAFDRQIHSGAGIADRESEFHERSPCLFMSCCPYPIPPPQAGEGILASSWVTFPLPSREGPG